MVSLGALFVLLSLPLGGQGLSTRPSVELLIPKDMPIKFEAMRDLSDSEMIKYTFKRTVPKDASRAKIITVMVDNAGLIKHVSASAVDHLTDPMSIATVDKSVVRILVIVEWLETDRGKWVLDTKTPELDIELLVKDGAKTLPRSKFLSK